MPIDNQQVTTFISSLNSPQKEICQQLRMMIKTNFPEIEEKWGWSRPLYATPAGYVCYMVANKHDVNFGFEYGVRLTDPKGLLMGTGINQRHLKIRKLDDLDLEYYQQLLAQAIKLATTVC